MSTIVVIALSCTALLGCFAIIRRGATGRGALRPRAAKLAVAAAALAALGSAMLTAPPAATGSSACPCTIWSSSATPATPNAGDSRANELGVRFRADVSGFVSGVRFFKGSRWNNGTHVGHLWTAGGALLGSATFTSETSYGWQQVLFAKPVPVAANTDYIASYYAPHGHYAADQFAFATTGVDNTPLHAAQDTSTAADGVYRYQASGFPVSTYHATNYWVDVVFTNPGVPPSTTAPASSTPPPSSSTPPASSSAASSSAPPPSSPPASSTPASSTPVSSTPASSTPASSSSASTTPTPTPTPPAGVHKVLLVLEENNDRATAMANMPNLAGWGATYGQATGYFAITHPSLPNYLAIWGGSTFGITTDCGVGQAGCVPTAPSLWGQVIAAGKSAKAYQESMPASCYLTDSGTYAPRHGPWAYWTDATERSLCAANDVASGSTAAGSLLSDVSAGTLPVVGEVTPNLCNDAHDCSLATADGWLGSWIPKIMAGPDYRSGNLTILITFDEGSSASNNVAFVAIDPRLHGTTVTGSYDHYSLERWLASVAGVAPLRNAATAADLRTAFGL